MGSLLREKLISFKKGSFACNLVLLFLLVLVVGAFISALWINDTIMISNSDTISEHLKVNPIVNTKISPSLQKSLPQPSKPDQKSNLSPKSQPIPKRKPAEVSTFTPLKCPTRNQTGQICPLVNTSLIPQLSDTVPPSPTCPDYFRWIHEDLLPWKSTGITREMVERARRTANFRLVILNGKAYVELYHHSFQSRDVFTLWGIAQLVRRYPGRIPDLDLMFDCVDWPIIRAKDYHRKNASAPPPLFRYCGDDSTLDIVFPDWSFWGWPEINIKPWEVLRNELKKGNDLMKWIDRDPYAYWKGNPAVATTRQELLNCNVSETQDWNARIYAQDWLKETKDGFKESDLSKQCIHRYKIYIEGSAWSVSEKYILACNSLTLLVKPKYYDFFTRGLKPVQHYWPIKEEDKCRSIKFAVNWGNSHKQKAQAIGNEASNFIDEYLKMDYVYDYMFHLLTEYAKLLRYKPTIPEKATELCAESMACYAGGLKKQFMMDSLVKPAHDSEPCTLPPPYNRVELNKLLTRKSDAIKQVETWEQRAWNNQQDK